MATYYARLKLLKTLHRPLLKTEKKMCKSSRGSNTVGTDMILIAFFIYNLHSPFQDTFSQTIDITVSYQQNIMINMHARYV